MSYAIKRNKIARGDPGLWSALRGAGEALLGGRGVGGAVQAAAGELGLMPSRRTLPSVIQPVATAGHGMPGMGVQINPPFGGPPGAGMTLTGPGGFGLEVGFGEMQQMYGAYRGSAPPMNGAGPKGYKLNKTAYYRRDPQTGQVIHVQPGTRWVRIRKRNPANARASDRAISRLESAKRLQSRLSRVTIRKKKCECCG